MIVRDIGCPLDTILGEDLVFSVGQILEEVNLVGTENHRLIAVVVVEDHEGRIITVIGNVVVSAVLVERDEDFNFNVTIAGSGAVVRQVPSDAKIIAVSVERQRLRGDGEVLARCGLLRRIVLDVGPIGKVHMVIAVGVLPCHDPSKVVMGVW